MQSLLCPVNPRYNGHHVCPQCGGASFWSCFDPAKPRIQVECQNGCGTYEKAHAELESLPFFDLEMH